MSTAHSRRLSHSSTLRLSQYQKQTPNPGADEVDSAQAHPQDTIEWRHPDLKSNRTDARVQRFLLGNHVLGGIDSSHGMGVSDSMRLSNRQSRNQHHLSQRLLEPGITNEPAHGTYRYAPTTTTTNRNATATDIHRHQEDALGPKSHKAHGTTNIYPQLGRRIVT